MAQEEHGAVIRRLVEHYQNNVLVPEPNPKFEEVKLLLENPELRCKVAADGLNKSYHVLKT